MSVDLFEQLARREVPPPPADLRRGVHRRLNKFLLATHVVDFALRGVPYCAGHFLRAAIGWMHLTLTGRHAADRLPRSTDEGRHG